ncbi:CPBP family intramembrane glutamic endopeptidase [Paraburkholderia phymatum]|uniref:Abortive infection protein n=1 Tax=Paraburkholderia phymatum (strain DSM 17167 / CIP 108236 / LMG 21445 / STM815) TaxID=391038 RepID=B2JUG9_PARP8|nr:Abortive infection protein [Paraburkholderia phymatum STM815]
MTLSITWIALFLAAPTTLIARIRWPGTALLIIACCAALAVGQLAPAALIALALLIFAAYAIAPERARSVRYAGHVLFVALAVGLSTHWLPGFHNQRVIGPERITPDAVPFTMYLNLDKPLIGFWLLLAVPWMRGRYELRTSLKVGLLSLLATTAACLAVAQLLGVVGWAPKHPAHSGLWLLNNLFLVSVTEEALFRGYLQGGLARLLARRKHADGIAFCVSTIVFALAHAPGGWQWIVLAGIAGAGYGLAWRYGGLQASVLAHFGLNTAHFFFFTYPMLQAAVRR